MTGYVGGAVYGAWIVEPEAMAEENESLELEHTEEAAAYTPRIILIHY